MRRDLLKVSEAIGVAHPELITVDDVDLVDENRHPTSLRKIFEYDDGWSSLGPALREEITEIMMANIPAAEPVPHN